MCRSVEAQLDEYSHTYRLEEIVFAGAEGEITRYDLVEAINFGGLYTRASLEQGKLVEVTPSPGNDFGDIEESEAFRRARAKDMFHTFAEIMGQKSVE
jgi:hypothetical protein